MAAKKRASSARAVEWIGGCAPMPAYVTGEGEPYRPELLIWMSADGLVLGCDAAEPGALLPQAAALLRKTMARPMVGPPHAPTRIRVASSELASALRDAVPGVTIVEAPTPELDDVLESMRRSMSEGGSGPTTYLTEDIDEPAVAAFFRASAAFHRAAPWRVMPADAALMVSLDELGVHGLAVTTVGQHGSAYGFMVFGDVASYRAFVDGAGDGLDAPGESSPHLAVHLGPPHETPEALVAEAAKHRWETAAADAIPWPVALDEDLVQRPMTADELLVVEAIALAVGALAASTPDLERAWWGGEPVTRTITVVTHQGPLAVTLGAPAEAFTVGRAAPPPGVVADLGLLEETAEELDVARVDELSAQLVAELRASPEGKALPDGASWSELLMMLGVRHFDATIASIGPEELRGVLEELIPRKVIAPASEAGAAIEELRALYAFLGRAHHLEQAAACLEVLGPEAEKRLEAALARAKPAAPTRRPRKR